MLTMGLAGAGSFFLPETSVRGADALPGPATRRIPLIARSNARTSPPFFTVPWWVLTPRKRPSVFESVRRYLEEVKVLLE